MDDAQDKITVWVGNLGRYNEGDLVGDWILLPVSDQTLRDFLTDSVGIDLDPIIVAEKSAQGRRVYEEFFVADFEDEGLLHALSYRPGEFDRLEDLNLLAAVASEVPWDVDAVRCALDYDIVAKDPLELANLVAQSDDIPFFRYDFAAYPFTDESADERFGLMAAEQSGLFQRLERENVLDYFDFERYGEDVGQDYHLTDEGYLDCRESLPDVAHYGRDELVELVENVLRPDDLSHEGNAPLSAISREAAAEERADAGHMAARDETVR